MNKVILSGRLGRDPEMRYTQSGKAICNFSLAVNRKKDKDGNRVADFIPCQAWEKLAEIVGNNLVKGSQVLIEGRMQIRSYEAQDGSKRYVTEVICNEVEFIGPKPDHAAGPADAGGFGGEPVNDGDIPF